MRMWVFERQFVGLAIFTLLVLGLLFFGVRSINYGPSCFDKIKNGDEEEIDCGGSCNVSCLGEVPKNPEKIWARFFPAREGMYDAGAFITNPNFQAGTRQMRYTFRLYDGANVLIAKKEGVTFIYPRQDTFVFEPNLDTGFRKPARAVFDIDNIRWERIREKDPLNIEVVGKTFEPSPFPLVRVTLANRSLFEEPALEVSMLLEQSGGTVYAVSRTVIENFMGESTRTVVFTWPALSFASPVTITPLYRRVLK